jgi:RimJ/RimL family protein N-acetyltransferase
MTDIVLEGSVVRLEPLGMQHLAGLVRAAAVDPSIYRWSPVPRDTDRAAEYVATALAWRDAGTAMPYAIVRRTDERVIGSSRFFELTRWAWPAEHPSFGRHEPDVGEIGYTWYAADATRTAANTETKLLMLTQAFETWRMLRICLHSDARNARSRAAIERVGGRFEGILRAHRLAADIIPRDSARYSILAEEWPAVKERLRGYLTRS